MEVPEALKTNRFLSLLLVPQLNLMVQSYCQTQITLFGYRQRHRNQAGNEVKASSLMAGFHTARRCYTSCWEHQQSSYPARHPVSYNTDFPGECAHWQNRGMPQKGILRTQHRCCLHKPIAPVATCSWDLTSPWGTTSGEWFLGKTVSCFYSLYSSN